MKLSIEHGDKRILRLLIIFWAVFSILAAVSGAGMYLFSIVVVGLFWLFSRLLLKSRWYVTQHVRYVNGEFKIFPFVQSLIILLAALLFIAFGFGLLALLDNAL
jgi:hypothetical protein